MPTAEDAFLQRARSARTVGAVLKSKLITVRSNIPNSPIFVFEGDDDKIIYGQWVRRIRPDLRYEPFPCGGKKGVRDLKNLVSRDLAGLGTHVFFFVDRDFDDLEGFIDTSSVFMTETYSVENYLVVDEVLESLLRDEFPCHTKPDVRRAIIQTFGKDYDQFLTAVADVNRRIYYARKIPINTVNDLPSSLNRFISILIGNITTTIISVNDVVILEREPTVEEQVYLAEEFAALAPRLRFRGKFAIKFFMEWLRKLADRWDKGDLDLFGENPPAGSVRRAEFVISNFAAKSQIPTNLPPFILTIE